jgi:hypothetical protein
MLGALLTTWTIRLALVCYLGTLVCWLVGDRAAWQKAARGFWTAGCVLFVLHVVCAMHFTHHWSHASAIAKTARVTQQLLGVAVGEGLYASYFFLLLWVADVAWLWLAPASYLARPKWTSLAVHLYMGFIALNGAIVFEAGPTRWAGLAACAGLLALVAWRLLRSQSAATYSRTTGSPATGDEQTASA